MIGSLEKLLSELPHGRRVLWGGVGCETISQLHEKALTLRERLGTAGQGCVALRGLPPLELLIALVALDGRARKLLLLPTAVDKLTGDRLISALSANCVICGDLSFEQVDAPKPAPEDEPVSPSATKWVLATSGTTGEPKLVEHNLSTLSHTVRCDTKRGEEFVWGLVYDPNRFAGLQVLLQAILSGSGLALPAEADFDSMVSTLLNAGVNALSATPTLWRKMLMDGRVQSLPLKQITLGGEIVDQSILSVLQHQFPGARVVHIYASTEAGTGFSVKDGRAGFPLAWIDNAEVEPALRISGVGHLLIKPPQLPAGDVIDSRLDAEGFLDTEDLVEIADDRVLFLGRASGAINVGGNKVSPEQIECYLRSLDGVMDAKVFAKKSSMAGQLVCAEIVPEHGVDQKELRRQILAACRRDLPPWQTPALLSFATAIKESAAGKQERKKT